MKRPWLILAACLALGLLAYAASYFAGSARSRHMTRSPTPELSWLQVEFHLSDAELARIEKLHESYAASCAERCARIDARNAELKRLLAATNTITPEIERAVQDSARLRAECQTAMLQHFNEIRRSMPPDQGERYFHWIVGCTFGSEHESMTHVTPRVDHERHGD